MEFTFQFLVIFFLDLKHAAPLLISLLVFMGLLGYTIGRIEGWSLSDSL
jgi:hypothetical protein